MSEPLLEFWFDFSSPYGYLASLEVESVAARCGRRVLWRPFMLGVAFKRTGMAPLTNQPLRGAYALRDWRRAARRQGRTFVLPTPFPVVALAPSRMFYAIERQAPAAAAAFAVRCFVACFETGEDISQPDRAADIGDSLGLDREKLLAAHRDPACKQLLIERTQEALDRGVFGAPFFFADNEPFWGWDRLSMAEAWMRAGGW